MIHLPSLLAFLRDVCGACRPPADDLTALARATGVYVDDYGYRTGRAATPADETTPEHDALADLFARIDAACADWAAEVDAIADVELAELIAEEGRDA